jgi:hypothetical protein
MNNDEKLELYFKEAQEIIPSIKFSSSLYFGDGNNNKAEIEFSIGNKIIESLFKSIETSEYIHYTNLQSFIEILNSSKIRMHNCANLNDPREIEYGLQEFGLELTPSIIEEFKRNHFIFSACNYGISLPEDFSMWRFYGDNGKGIGIIFEIENGEEDYQNHGIHIGNVQYGNNNDKMKLLKQFFKFHFNFNSKHNLFSSQIPTLFPLMSSFFKKEIWQIENEFRIVANCKLQNDFYPIENSIKNNCNSFLKETIKSTLNKKGEIVSYLELPIKSINNNKLSILCPKILIKEIKIGYDVSSKVKESIVRLTKQIGTEKLGYDIQYSDSIFK